MLNMSRVLVFFHTCLFTLMTTEAVAKSIGLQFGNKEYWAEKPLNENVTLFRLVRRMLTCSAFSVKHTKLLKWLLLISQARPFPFHIDHFRYPTYVETVQLVRLGYLHAHVLVECCLATKSLNLNNTK